MPWRLFPIGALRHARNDEARRYGMHRKAQDIVVSGFSENLGNMALHGFLAQIQLSGNFFARLRFAYQTQNRKLGIGELRRVGENALLRQGEGRISLDRRANDA